MTRQHTQTFQFGEEPRDGLMVTSGQDVKCVPADGGLAGGECEQSDLGPRAHTESAGFNSVPL